VERASGRKDRRRKAGRKKLKDEKVERAGGCNIRKVDGEVKLAMNQIRKRGDYKHMEKSNIRLV
jgi:hypothetical protein